MPIKNDNSFKFPKEHVNECRDDDILQSEHNWESVKDKYLENADGCPSCGCDAEELSWFYFSSPKWTWEHLCGSEGWMAVCDHCDLQVNFFCLIRN